LTTDTPPAAGPGDDEVAAAARGDRAAWATLYRWYAPIIHSLLLLTVARRDADELTQEVFLKAMPRLKDLRDNAALGAWLCQIARNEAATWGRKKRTSSTHLASLSRAPTKTNAPDNHPLDPDAVLNQLRTLPEAYRETLALRLIAGLTGPQIAAATGLTPASVRVNLCRGMAMLRGALGVGAETAGEKASGQGQPVGQSGTKEGTR
jgi:RNA polymerase sigma-70 factor (ECF subfamily)